MIIDQSVLNQKIDVDFFNPSTIPHPDIASTSRLLVFISCCTFPYSLEEFESHLEIFRHRNWFRRQYTSIAYILMFIINTNCTTCFQPFFQLPCIMQILVFFIQKKEKMISDYQSTQNPFSVGVLGIYHQYSELIFFK